MKRAVLILIILSLVSGLGLGAAALALESQRDAAYIASASETGGGVSLEGLRLGARAEFRGRAGCRLVHTLCYNAASDSSICGFELRYGSEYTDTGSSYWTPFINDWLNAGGSGTYEPDELPAPCRYILGRSEPGKTHTETFPLSDCCDSWPFIVDDDLSNVSADMNALLSGELAQPVPEDAMVTASVTLNAKGEIKQFNCSVTGGSSIWADCRVLGDFYVLSFADMDVDYEAARTRAYVLDARWSEEYGAYVPDVSSLRYLTQLGELSASIDTPAGGGLLLEAAEDGYTLIQLSAEGELMGTLHADYTGAEYRGARLVAGGDWTLLVQEGLVTAFGYEDGRIVHGHDYELPSVSFARDYDYIYAYDGDRLCALAVGRSIGWYSGEPGYSEETLLIAADTQGNVLERTLDFPLLLNSYSSFDFELSLG